VISGIGTDIVEIERIKQALGRHSERFLQRLLTDSEQLYWEERGSRAETLAGFWAAKEAIAKALGTGFREFALRDIVISHDEYGKPEVRLFSGAKACADGQAIERVLVTISHSDQYAVAFALVE
jgi:holo-[acyl-carrier-protein] synthase